MEIQIQKELTDRLDRASRNYYNALPTEYTDVEFDIKFKELQAMEKESGLIFPNSPTIRVGSDIQDGFKKGNHPKPMLTIENVFSDEDLQKWVDKMHEDYDINVFNVSVKYDGISCELHYHDGKLVQALTRGDKNVGDDITINVKTIKNIPLVLRTDIIGKTRDFYIRGEILLPKSRLIIINEERKLNGEQTFANTRNACAGSIKQLDPKVTASRRLIFKAWDCFGDYEITSMADKTTVLEGLGFYYEEWVNDYKAQFLSTKPFSVGYKDLVASVNRFKKALSEFNLDYDYDGIVIKVDDVEVQDRIGTKDTRAIEWGIARKWNDELVVTTKLLDVEWQVGRTGVLTPVAILEPVECGGVVISNATLHNWNFIQEKGIKIGDVLKITRSGGVIPYVLGIVESDESSSPVPYPDTCPYCGSKTVSDGSAVVCPNPDCPVQVEGKVLYFCSKGCMDIHSVGRSVVHDLNRYRILRTIPGLYVLRNFGVNSLVTMLGTGYGKKKVKKMLEEIEKSKFKPFANLLAGLSIPNVGIVMARALAKRFKTMKAFMACTREDLVEIDGIGDKMAEDIYNWCHNEDNASMVEILIILGLNCSEEDEEEKGHVGNELEGMTVCFSGSSNRFKGEEVEAFLERHGAKCIHSVSKKIDMLVIGEKPGPSKVKKAEEYGIFVLTEDEFYKKYNL